jgi:hypothetical protein
MFKQIEHMFLIANVGNGEGMREETDERQRILMKQQEQPFCNIFSSASKKPSRVSQVVVPPSRSSRQSTASPLRPAQCGTQLLEPRDPTKIPGGLGKAWIVREF